MPASSRTAIPTVVTYDTNGKAIVEPRETLAEIPTLKIPPVIGRLDSSAGGVKPSSDPIGGGNVSAKATADSLEAFLQELQRLMQSGTLGARSSFLLRSVLHKNITVPPGVKRVVQHKLGKAYEGWMIVRPREGPPTITEFASDNTSPEQHLVLRNIGTADVLVDLLIW